MIISRRRLKMMLAEEYERARVETEERFYRREEIQHLHDRLNRMGEEIQRMKEPAESCDNSTYTQVPRPF